MHRGILKNIWSQNMKLKTCFNFKKVKKVKKIRIQNCKKKIFYNHNTLFENNI